MKKIIKKNLKWIIGFICLIGFFILVQQVFSKKIVEIDTVGYQLISHFLISDFATPIARFITSFGGIVGVGSLAVILWLVIKNKKIGILILGNVCIAACINLLLKQILQRPRPIEYRLIEETGYSFPSGHSMVSTAFYGFLIYLVYQYVKNKYLRVGLIVVLSILIISICISRIYLGVHYTTDVIAGFLLSISYLVIYISSVQSFIKASE